MIRQNFLGNKDVNRLKKANTVEIQGLFKIRKTVLISKQFISNTVAEFIFCGECTYIYTICRRIETQTKD